MLDKNGVEIKTGDIVEITGAFFKNDNGLYFVECSPGDPSWSGKDYCLKKISKAGKISTAKYNLCFWPILTFVSDQAKTVKAHQWNREHATIEVKEPLKDMGGGVCLLPGEGQRPGRRNLSAYPPMGRECRGYPAPGDFQSTL